jgi:hypothetical protein
MELDRLQHDGHAACVIAQQYSSVISNSLGFHFHGNNSARIKVLLLLLLLLLLILTQA